MKLMMISLKRPITVPQSRGDGSHYPVAVSSLLGEVSMLSNNDYSIKAYRGYFRNRTGSIDCYELGLHTVNGEWIEVEKRSALLIELRRDVVDSIGEAEAS